MARIAADVATIPLGPSSPTTSMQPTRTAAWKRARTRPFGTVPAIPIRSCSGRGLPCRSRCRSRGALLPHPFTLAAPRRGGLLSVALSLGSPPPVIIRHPVSVEPGLSSISVRTAHRNSGRPANWPAHLASEPIKVNPFAQKKWRALGPPVGLEGRKRGKPFVHH